jgi:hypothetical protein
MAHRSRTDHQPLMQAPMLSPSPRGQMGIPSCVQPRTATAPHPRSTPTHSRRNAPQNGQETTIHDNQPSDKASQRHPLKSAITLATTDSAHSWSGQYIGRGSIYPRKVESLGPEGRCRQPPRSIPTCELGPGKGSRNWTRGRGGCGAGRVAVGHERGGLHTKPSPSDFCGSLFEGRHPPDQLFERLSRG